MFIDYRSWRPHSLRFFAIAVFACASPTTFAAPSESDAAEGAVCADIGASNCQYPLGDGLVYMSDLAAPGSGVVVADDFVPYGDTLSSVCVWGAYLDPTGPGIPGALGTEQYSCSGTPIGERFRVRVFDDNGTGLPDTLIGESTVSGSNIISSPQSGTYFESAFGIAMQSLQLTLDSPIAGLQPGSRYWLEVGDYTRFPEGNLCSWHWAQYISPDQDGYSVTGISPAPNDPDDLFGRPSIYVNGSAHSVDLAFCLSGPNGPLDFDAPPAQLGSCWTCADCPELQPCSVSTLRACMQQNGNWDRDDSACLQLGPPPAPNDFCGDLGTIVQSEAPASCGDGVVDPGEQCDDGNLISGDGCSELCRFECEPYSPDVATSVAEGLYWFDNSCTTRDGPGIVRGDAGDFRIDGDLWFPYTASSTGIATVSTCATQTAWTQDGYSGLDSSIAVYHEYATRCVDGDNQDQLCQCPGQPPRSLCTDFAQCPGGSGVCRNLCPCPGTTTQVSSFQFHDASNESCSGIPDQGGGFIEFTTFPNECYLIQVGSFGDPQASEESQARGPGLLDISLQVEVPFPTQPAIAEYGTNESGQSLPWARPRMISFQGGDPGRSQAVRVTFADMPPGWEEWNGVKLFVQEPWIGSENPGVSFYDPPASGEPGIQLAELGCDPYFTDWNALGVVHVIHPAIAPSRLASPAGPIENAAKYDVQVVDSTCALSVESCYTDPLTVETSGWGDLTSLTGGTYRIPDDKIAVDDLVGIVAAFSGAALAPSKASASLLGVYSSPSPKLDGRITVFEITSVVAAFKGQPYEFTAADIAPPPTCP